MRQTTLSLLSLFFFQSMEYTRYNGGLQLATWMKTCYLKYFSLCFAFQMQRPILFVKLSMLNLNLKVDQREHFTSAVGERASRLSCVAGFLSRSQCALKGQAS